MEPIRKIDTVEDFAVYLQDLFNNHATVMKDLQRRVENLEAYTKLIEARRQSDLEKGK
jgi:hypothetical protein